MDFFTFQTAWTVVAVLIFTGVVWWAVNPKNKNIFDNAACIPMNDEKGEHENLNKEKNHG